MELHTLLLPIGIALPLLGWSFYRKPAVPFFQLGPIKRLSDLLTPTGVTLYWAGIATGFAGLALRWLA